MFTVNIGSGNSSYQSRLNKRLFHFHLINQYDHLITLREKGNIHNIVLRHGTILLSKRCIEVTLTIKPFKY